MICSRVSVITPSTGGVIQVAFILALLVSFAAGGIVSQRYYEKTLQRPDTVYKVKWIHDSIPVPHDSLIYITKVVSLPIHDTTQVHDTTTVRDSVLVDVPIWEKSYVTQNYNLTIRGFQPELVDIWIRQKETVITVPYRKKWSFTIGPQAGIGITPNGFQPYAGAGITFGYSF